MHFRLAVIAALAIAVSAHAGITFDPPAPTTHDFVKLVVDENFWPGHCAPLRGVVTRSDRTIDVFWGDSEECVLIPEIIITWQEVVPISVLEAGQYTVNLRGVKRPFRTMSLFVTAAQPDLAVIHPFASTRGDSTVVLRHPARAEHLGLHHRHPQRVAARDGGVAGDEAGMTSNVSVPEA